MIRYVEIVCPHCQHGLRVRAEYLGQRVRCRFCSQDFEAKPSDQPGATAEAAPVQPARGASLRLLKTPRPTEEVREGVIPWHRAGANESGAWPVPLEDDRPPFDVPGYRIEGKVRDGSMGVVYRAVQESLDRVVALKLLRDVRGRPGNLIERFKREGRIAARLSHPNVVAVYDAGQVNSRSYLVMEFIVGETIQHLLDTSWTFAEGPALEVAIQLAEALRHLNHRGVVHRDVKPANVMLTPEGGVKLIDFGLARPVSDAAWGKSEEGLAIGTAEFISPEQACGLPDIDVRSDIYGLGGTLYRMVTGRVPHTGVTPREVMRRHVDPGILITSPRALRPELSEHLEAVLGMMLARHRDHRYVHPDDLLDDLRRVLRGEPPTFAPPQTSPPQGHASKAGD